MPAGCWRRPKATAARRTGAYALGDAFAAEGRPHRLSLADPPLHRPKAVFLFVTAAEVPDVASRFGATPFDIDGVSGATAASAAPSTS